MRQATTLPARPLYPDADAAPDIPYPSERGRTRRRPPHHARDRRPAGRDPGRPSAGARSPALRGAQPVAGKRGGRSLPSRPPRAVVLAPAGRDADPAGRRGPRARRRRPRRARTWDHRPPEASDAARHGQRERAPGGGRPALPEGRDLAARGGDLRLQARGPFWRLRVGELRIVCWIDDEARRIVVLRVAHRNEVDRACGPWIARTSEDRAPCSGRRIGRQLLELARSCRRQVDPPGRIAHPSLDDL